jgi:hypothetical protein
MEVLEIDMQSCASCKPWFIYCDGEHCPAGCKLRLWN